MLYLLLPRLASNESPNRTHDPDHNEIPRCAKRRERLFSLSTIKSHFFFTSLLHSQARINMRNQAHHRCAWLAPASRLLLPAHLVSSEGGATPICHSLNHFVSSHFLAPCRYTRKRVRSPSSSSIASKGSSCVEKTSSNK